jgi:hypothetical protein
MAEIGLRNTLLLAIATAMAVVYGMVSSAFRGNADELAVALGAESPTIKFHFRRSGARVSNAGVVRGPRYALKQRKYHSGAEEERRAECGHPISEQVS